jgi:ribonuclease-3
LKLSKNIFNRFSEEDKALQKALKNLLGFTPGHLPYYIISITHRSRSDKVAHNNERLEYLGDAFIGAIVGEYLFKKYPGRDEGYLTEMRSKIVSRNSLNEIARRMGLQRIIRYNQADRLLRHSQIFGNALEALVGAIYLDMGFEKTRKFILKRILATYIDMEELEHTEFNFKNKLYSWAQRHDKAIELITISEKLEAGRKIFTVGISIDGEIRTQAAGYSKKEAGQLAAKAAVASFAGED